MKNERGVTLATVMLVVVVTVIIASTSIFVGNRLIQEAKEQKRDENYNTVLDAVRREAAKGYTGGIISPGVTTYPGVKNPIIGRDKEDNPIYIGNNWYFVDSSALLELGIENINDTYLVNYEYSVVIDVNATDDIIAESQKYAAISDNSGGNYIPINPGGQDIPDNPTEPDEPIGNYTVTFDANDGVVGESTRVVAAGEQLGTLPIPSRTEHFFDGWYTTQTGGTSVDENKIINSNVTYYAHWTKAVAQIGRELYHTLQEAVDDVPTTEVQTTVKLLQNTSEKIIIASGQNVLFDLQSYRLSSIGSNATVDNSGILTLQNGTILAGNAQAIVNKNQLSISGTVTISTSSDVNTNVVENRASSYLTVTGGTISVNSTSGGIAIRNMGVAEISGTAVINSVANKRECIKNENSTASLTITGGTITAKSSGIVNGGGVLTIGKQDGDVDTRTPVMQGSEGVVGRFNFYDGVIKAENEPFDIFLVDGIESGYKLKATKVDVYNVVYPELTSTLASTMTAYANDLLYYGTVQYAVNLAPTDTQVTLKLLKDVSEYVEIPLGKNVIFDLQSYKLSNVASNKNVIVNRGTAKVIGGTIESNAGSAAIDNYGILEVNGITIRATGNRQAIYNSGGTVTISGSDTYLEAQPGDDKNRGTVDNLSSGTITITGGKIVSKKSGSGIGVYNASGIVKIGTDDGTINTTSPIILGEKYGVRNGSTVNFYDGKLGGKASTSESAGRIGTLNIPDNTTIKEGTGITETIDGVLYNVAYIIAD